MVSDTLARTSARATKGMVASPHALATEAGVEVLRHGGNAVDAAVATNAVLSVVYPHANGLGGDALWMIYDPEDREVVCYNGSGRAPRALDAHLLRERGFAEMPARGAIPVTIPGCVRSWEDVLAAHGTRELDDLLQAAESFARDGYEVSKVLSYYIALNEQLLRECPDAHALFLSEGVPQPGAILCNPGLAKTLAQIRRGGADAFYDGAAAEAIVAKLRAGGSPVDLEDFHEHRGEQTPPWRIGWRGGEILAHPPNSHGSCAQIVLGAIAGDQPGEDGAWSHLAIEAFKHAFRIRDTRFGDPDFVDLEAEEFLAPQVLAKIRGQIDPEHVRGTFYRVDHGDTVAIVAVDDEGRAVSLIESLYMNFGSGLVAGESGIVLQNRGAYFNLIEGHPNALAGEHRPVHTLSPAMYLRDDRPELVYGTMGGDGQPQVHTQLLHHILERNADVQVAIDAPRWVAGRPHIPGREDVMTDVVLVESRMPDDVVEGLERRGHKVERLTAYDHTMGHAHAIRFERESGTLVGGSDPRADSLALGV